MELNLSWFYLMIFVWFLVKKKKDKKKLKLQSNHFPLWNSSYDASSINAILTKHYQFSMPNTHLSVPIQLFILSG